MAQPAFAVHNDRTYEIEPNDELVFSLLAWISNGGRTTNDAPQGDDKKDPRDPEIGVHPPRGLRGFSTHRRPLYPLRGLFRPYCAEVVMCIFIFIFISHHCVAFPGSHLMRHDPLPMKSMLGAEKSTSARKIELPVPTSVVRSYVDRPDVPTMIYGRGKHKSATPLGSSCNANHVPQVFDRGASRLRPLRGRGLSERNSDDPKGIADNSPGSLPCDPGFRRAAPCTPECVQERRATHESACSGYKRDQRTCL